MTTMTTTDHLRPPVRTRGGAARATRALPDAPRTRRTAADEPSHEPGALFTRLLVPLDLTGDSKAALDTALLMAQRTRAEIVLLHVVPEIEGAPRRAHPAFYRALERSAEAKLEKVAKRFWKKHLRVRQEIRVGDPLAEILGCVKKSEIDLIVLRSHRYAGKPGRGWGTVSYRVASLCDCPVLLAK